MKYIFILLLLFSCKKEIGKEMVKETIVPNTVSIKGSKITYYTYDKNLYVKDIDEGEIEYSKKVEEVFVFKPILINEKTLITAFDGNTLGCINIDNGNVKWEYTFESKIMDIKYFNNKVLIVNIKDYGIVALDIKGKLIYNILYDYNICFAPDTSPYSVFSSEEMLFVSSLNCKTVTAYNINSGELIWSFKKNFSVLSDVFYFNNKVFVAINNYYKEGKLLVLNSNSGKILYEKGCNIETRLKPVLYKEKLYYYTFFGSRQYSSIIEFNTNNFEKKIIYKMTKDNDISGRQIYKLNDNIFFNDNKLNIIKLSLNDYNFNIVREDVTNFNGVTYLKNDELFFIN